MALALLHRSDENSKSISGVIKARQCETLYLKKVFNVEST